MNCEQFEILCIDYLDDTLTEAERAGMQAHIAICPECAEYLEDIRQITRSMPADKIELPQELHEDIMNLIMAESQMGVVQPFDKKRRRPPVFTMMAAACAVVILGVSGTIGDWVTNGRDMIAAGGGAGAPEAAMAAIESEDTGAAMYGHVTGELGDDALFIGESTPDGAAQGEDSQQFAVWSGAGDSTEKNDGGQIDPAPQESPEIQTAGGAVAPSTRIQAFTADVPMVNVPASIKNVSYAFCLMVRAQESDLPVFEGRLLEADEATGISYFSVKNSVSLLESLTAAFAEKGLELTSYGELDLVTIDREAENGLLILLSE